MRSGSCSTISHVSDSASLTRHPVDHMKSITSASGSLSLARMRWYSLRLIDSCRGSVALIVGNRGVAGSSATFSP
jgi:hypothetical protein